MAHPPAEALELLAEERTALEETASSPSLPYRAVREARGLLLATDAVANSVIAKCLEVSRSTVIQWRQHFVEHGVARVGKVRPGRGRKPTIPQARIEAMVHDTLHARPDDGLSFPPRGGHWSSYE